MKRFKKFLLIFIFVMAFPMFAFACDETTFDDIPYVSSSKTPVDLISEIDNTRNLMINSIELKVSLTTTNTYTFKNMFDNYGLEDKVVKDVIKTTIGKNSDNPSAAIVELTRYVNDKKSNYEKISYVHSVSPNGTENSYVYTERRSFDSEGNVLNANFSRDTYNQASVSFLSLYNNAVYVIASNQVDNVAEKSFEDVNYYKLTSDVNGLYYVNDSFNEDKYLYNNPKMFSMIDDTQDYVKPFSCEFGLKSTEGYNYITYSTVKYEVENKFREVYLTVSSHTELDKYGDSVSVSGPEDKDKYTANSFLQQASQDEFYITYNMQNASTQAFNKVSVAKFTETFASGDNVTSYSVEVIEQNGTGVGGNKFYYYLQGNTDGTFITYLLDLENKTYTEDGSYSLEWLQFNFSLGYDNKYDSQMGGSYYQFGSISEYTRIVLTNGEVSKISSKKNGEQNIIELNVLEYGSEPEVLGLTQSLEEFSAR